MTDFTQGRGGSPSVAALAVQVNALRRDVEALTGKMDAFTRTQEEQAIVLDGIVELRNQVEKLGTLLSEEGQPSPPGWFWLTMDEPTREEKFSELHDWVDTVLRTQYPDYLANQVKPCWPNHPEAQWELAWLYQLWTAAYLVKRPAPKDAADWHDRWWPGALRRLSMIMNPCHGDCQRPGEP